VEKARRESATQINRETKTSSGATLYKAYGCNCFADEMNYNLDTLFRDYIASMGD
tara:strand:- start:728 stop:892 length:165 start_codon:yes stop_codon:yes gene_type:complete